MPPSNWLVFDRVREFTRANRIFQQERILQDQSAIDRITTGGEFLNFSSQSAILEQTNLQINRLERYKDYEQMDQTGEVSLACDLYADECVSGDTRILQASGACPTISELVAKGPDHEFWVSAYDIKNDKYVFAKAKAARVTKRNAAFVRVKWGGGHHIDCTPDHPFLTKQGWINAKDLVSGDSLVPSSMNYRKQKHEIAPPHNHIVESVESLDIVEDAYDITVPEYDCFAAGTDRSWVIIHNCSLIDPEHKHALIIRANDKKIKEELEEFYYETLMTDRIIRPAARYLCKFGDCPFEIVTDKNRSGVSSLRFMNVYNFTRVETRFGDLIGFFYQDDIYPEPIFLHPWACMHFRLTSFENIYHPYGRCQIFGTRVSTPLGYKNIEDFQADDMVHTFDGTKLVETKVLAACHSGKKKILKIWTKHCVNECSENHPVMVRQWIKRAFKFGEKWYSELVYKRADKLKIGNELVIPRLPIGSEEIELLEVASFARTKNVLTNACAKLTSNQHIIALPRCVNIQFAELFGFLIGDGWLKQSKGYITGIEFALGEHESINSKYELLLQSYGLSPSRIKKTGSQSKLKHDACYVYSVDFGLLMAEMGLCSGFDKKRVPEWVYRAKPEIQEAFILGLVESDGSTNIDEWDCERIGLELSNYELIKDTKMLLHQMGWKCGNIIKRQRDSNTTTIHNKECQRSDSWTIYFYKSDLFESAGRHVQRESGSRGYNARKKESEKYGENVVFEPIVAIEDGGVRETADIQVDSGYNNFVADGVVVHNCLGGDVLIDTPNGPIAIENIKPDQKVYSWDGAKAVEAIVSAQMCTGHKKLLEIGTRHHRLKCTAEHPVLVDGFGFKQAKDLKIGDRLVVPEITECGRFTSLELSQPSNANCVIPDIPPYANELFTEFFGFLIGDGWVTESSVEFALGEYPEVNQRYIAILESYGLHCSIRRSGGNDIAVVCHNVLLAGLMRRLGLIGKADKKNIPQWVFSSSQCLKEAFLRGYANADGCQRADGGIVMTSCNKKLLQSTRYLATSAGHKCGKISGPFSNNSELCASDKELLRYTVTYYQSGRKSNCLTDIAALQEAAAVNTSYAGTLRSLGYKPHGSMFDLLKNRCSEYNIDTSHFKGIAWNKGGRATAVLDSPMVSDSKMHHITEQIISISEIDGLSDVYDIQIDGHHNFLADGVVVHNSVLDGGRKAFKQLRLMEDAALIYRICLRGDQLIWTVDGHKPIIDIKIGDVVYCLEDGKPKLTKVINWMCNGKDTIYHIKSQHREIYANATHPILVERSFGNKQKIDRPARLEYVDVKDLIIKRNGCAAHHRFLLPQIEHTQYVRLRLPKVPVYARLKASALVPVGKTSISQKVGLRRKAVERFFAGDSWQPAKTAELLCETVEEETELEYRQGWVFNASHSICEEFNLPEYINEDFARLFGFMIGDGYASKRKSNNSRGDSHWVREVGIALGDNDDVNRQYIAKFSAYFGGSCSGDDRSRGSGKFYRNSRHLYDLVISNGFIPGAENKRIPNWVYLSLRSVQEAFIQGYIDADIGAWKLKNDNSRTESCEIECCNEMLTHDFKELFSRLGWQSGLVRKRERENGHEIEPGRVIPPTTGWCLYFTRVQKHDMNYTVCAGRRCSDSSEAILSVEEAGEDLVYDITVENEVHNFIANALPVGNTRAPEKRKYKIPVGLIPPKEVPEYMQAIARMFKRQRFYNPTTGTFDERYSPMVQEDDFFLPQRPDGSGPDIDVLPGAENLDQIADIEYFKKKMIAPMKIPFARVGIGEGAGEPNEKSLSQSHSEFAKAVKWIQSELALGFTKAGIVHLALRGYPVDALKGFELHLAASSAIEDLYRMETWQTRTAVMAELKDIGWFPKEWIVTRFTDLSPDEIQELEEMEDKETGGGMGGMGGMGGLPDEGDEDMPDIGGPDEDLPEGEGDEEEEPFPEEMESLREIGGRGLLLEMDHDAKKAKSLAYIKKLHAQKNAMGTPCFTHILEQKELDGLARGVQPESTGDGSVLTESWRWEPEEEDGMIVEWSVPRVIREEAISEVATILRGAAVRIVGNDEVTDADLPAH